MSVQTDIMIPLLRYTTDWFINDVATIAGPVTIVLQRQVAVDKPGGGRDFTVVDLPPQTFRLTNQTISDGINYSSNDDGQVRRDDYIMVGTFDADIQPNDTWSDVAPLELLSASDIEVVQIALSATSATSVSFSSPITAGNTIIVTAGTLLGSINPVLDIPTLDGNPIVNAFPIWNDSDSKAILFPNIAVPAWVIPNCPVGVTISFDVNNITYNAGFIAYEVAGLGQTPVVDTSSSNGGIYTDNIDSGLSGNISVPQAFVLGTCGTNQGAGFGASGFECVSPSINSWAGYQILNLGSNSEWKQVAITPDGAWAAGVAALSQPKQPTSVIRQYKVMGLLPNMGYETRAAVTVFATEPDYGS